MIGFLRFIGIVNAAVWFGAAVFFTFFAAPGFFTPEMKALIPPPFNGAAAELIVKRYFVLQNWCAGIAIVHVFAERLYTGRAIERLTMGLLVTMFTLGLVGGFGFQPKLHDLHVKKYRGATPEIRAEAAASFGKWHGIASAVNVLMLPGLLFYLWRITSLNRPSPMPAFRKMPTTWG